MIQFEKKFASLAVRALNIQPGQCVAIRSEPVHYSLIPQIAIEAYRAGARYVDFLPVQQAMVRARVDHANPEFLSDIPGYYRTVRSEYVRDHWAYLSIKSPDDPGVLTGADGKRLGLIAHSISEAEADFRSALSLDCCQWLVMVAPTHQWAKSVLGEVPGAFESFVDLLASIYRFDMDNPAEFWEEKIDELERRAGQLTRKRIRFLRFIGRGTDLTVELSPDALWRGGGSTSTDGHRFIANLPTEEVFTTPDARGTTGTVRITRPVLVYDTPVTGAWFRFEGGSVVESGAETGADALGSFLNSDGGSRRIGEVALVDAQPPIFQLPYTFSNILLDENAACHLALGFAYPTGIRNGPELDERQCEAVGLNRSREHVDFMIGDRDISVSAESWTGDHFEIIRKGFFVA